MRPGFKWFNPHTVKNIHTKKDKWDTQTLTQINTPMAFDFNLGFFQKFKNKSQPKKGNQKNPEQ
jgi:hypothetical protein